jgi:GH24 family phage-related lysozyme (muramidase)
MVRERCPEPGKRAYVSEAQANHARGRKVFKGNRMRAYRCAAGHWHLTSQAKI